MEAQLRNKGRLYNRTDAKYWKWNVISVTFARPALKWHFFLDRLPIKENYCGPHIPCDSQSFYFDVMLSENLPKWKWKLESGINIEI